MDYGTEAVLPTEIHLPQERPSELANLQVLAYERDTSNEKKESAHRRIMEYQVGIAR